MTDINRKVCIIGDFGVGKTSTVARYVHNVFSGKYLTTIGVKIDTKELSIQGQNLKMVIWDIAGTKRFSNIEFSYLQGAAGYILVADGTRKHTLAVAQDLLYEAQAKYGVLPYVVLVNKSDLKDDWEVSDEDLNSFKNDNTQVFVTSAKDGLCVQQALETLAERLVS